MKSSRTSSVLVLLLILLFVTTKPAHAYIDPGTGSYAFQFLIATILGSVFFLRNYLAKIISLFTKKSPKDKTAQIKKPKDGPS